MPNTIAKISLSTKDAIKRKSAYSLPDRPSDQGMKPDDIKRAFWQPIVDVTYSALTEIDRVIDEINNILNGVYDVHIVNANNPHAVTKAQVGLGNCNDTADANKPVSTPQITALNTHNADTMAHDSIRNSITMGLALKANITDIIDSFASTETNKALSAYRGKLLYDLLQTTDGKVELAIKSININSSNGILTITKTNGTTSTIDLPLEHMVQSGHYDSATKNIILELSGGTTIEIPATALVNEYYGDNASVTMYTDMADGNKAKFKISDIYKANIDSNTAARHSHFNKTILDAINVAFTTSLKTTYDGYALSISTEATNRQNEISRVEKLIVTKQGTTVTVGGVAQNAVAFTSDPQTQIDNSHPIGSVYQSVVNTSPASLFGGSWERFGNGRVLVGVDESDTDFANGKVGGEKAHMLTVAELAAHNGHIPYDYGFGDAGETTYFLPLSSVTAVGSNRPYVVRGGNELVHRSIVEGNGNPHNNLQPYTTVYIWRRIA